MLLRHGAVRGASFRHAGYAIQAGVRNSSCGQRDQHANGSPVHAAPRARPPRRRPLSTDATPSSSSSPPPQKQQLELEFPPPPPPQRGPISAASNLAGNDGSSGRGVGGDGDGGEPATAAAAAPGVTVDPGVSEDEDAPSFRRSDDVAERVGGDSGGGGDSRVVRDGYGPGASSWDDAWDVDGIGSAPSHGGDAGSPIGTQLGTQLGSTARLAGSGSGSGGAGGEGAGRGGRGRGVERVGVSNGEAVAQGGPKEEVKASRPGDERAHKMWVTGAGAGDSVSEHEWEAEMPSGSGKEDTAVIQFHSQREIDHRRFQGLGVVKEDKAEDIRTLVDSFTAPALAAALRDRETALHACAHLFEKGDLAGVRKTLLPFTARQVAESRRQLKRLDLDPEGFTTVHMYTLKKVLQRLPRHVTTLTEQRASVMIPLCNVDGVASVLFTKRSSNLRAHKNEVCFPGGKVDIGQDQHIIQTALREMGEEIGIQESSVDVLGVLRCDWAELASLIGVAVTPVVGFLGNLSREQINPNPDEVSHCFTIPIRYLLQQDRWQLEKYKAPAFVGGPYQIWGLTGYILHRLVNDVIRQHLVVK